MEIGLLAESVSAVVPHPMIHHSCLPPSVMNVGAGYVLTMDHCVVESWQLDVPRENTEVLQRSN